MKGGRGGAANIKPQAVYNHAREVQHSAPHHGEAVPPGAPCLSATPTLPWSRSKCVFTLHASCDHTTLASTHLHARCHALGDGSAGSSCLLCLGDPAQASTQHSHKSVSPGIAPTVLGSCTCTMLSEQISASHMPLKGPQASHTFTPIDSLNL